MQDEDEETGEPEAAGTVASIAPLGGTIGSLFAGIGGLELGLEQAGFGPTIWQVETDPVCRSVLAKHWPNATRYTDVCKVNAGNVAKVDLLCGGFPCQDISFSGKGDGLDGSRSGLWFEFLRLIREIRPRFVVVENVSAILVRGLGVVLGGLAEVGYDARWDCFRASDMGAPHGRDRWFLIAVAHSDSRRRHEVLRQDSKRSRECQPNWADTSSNHLACRDGGLAMPTSRWPPWPDDLQAWTHVPAGYEPAICRVAHGVSAKVDRGRIKSLGNAVVPAAGKRAGQMLRDFIQERG